jgi:hypothetical protein
MKEDVGIGAPAVVMTKEAAEQGPQLAVKAKTLLSPPITVGVTDATKNADGYLTVMVPPAGSTFVGVKPIVIGTGDLSAMRSEDEIANDAEVTKEVPPTMCPESTAFDASVSADVDTVHDTWPAVTAPAMKPEIVTVKGADGMLAPAVVTTIDVGVDELHIPDNPETLLLPTATLGVMKG